ncbi:MAG: RagB/SusD family nutrient uptake outer membrane protein [Bacteroidetes bacterium]|nr:RagB/SusD family nutrient uptake outer membrane protein [Bacteroidota bacterium]
MKKTFYILLIAVSLFSCKKTLLDTAPYDALASETMWTSDNLTDLGVNGVYNALRLGQNTAAASGLELYQIDQFSLTGQNRGALTLMQGTITPGDGMFSSTWQNFYEGIVRANDAIMNIPLKSPSVATKKARLIAESKFLRAYFYFRLNQVFKGVPIYLEPFKISEATKARATEQAVWDQVIKDLTDCINEPNLPTKYAKGNAAFGRATKAAAYALRGKVYMYTQKWDLAVADFTQVKSLGHTLFSNYSLLFKEVNEQSDEMIFPLTNIGVNGLGSTTQFFCGTRSSFGSCWNTYFPTNSLVDMYENIDGTNFSWDAIIPGYSTMTPAARQVYFLRDGLTAAEITAATGRGADMTKYLAVGNEARIQKAYLNRDPRLAATVITPYNTYNGVLNGANQQVISRFPYRASTAPTFDLQTDTQTFFYYLHRKFVYENSTELLNRSYGPIDFPIIRYADVLLMWAEALVELNNLPEAILKVNEVRTRAGMPLLQQTDATKGTYVTSQSNLRDRVRNERRIEFVNEGIDYFDEVRWNTWKTAVFKTGNGAQQVWGTNANGYTYGGDYMNTWPIPQVEIERNPNLKQNAGWPN